MGGQATTNQFPSSFGGGSGMSFGAGPQTPPQFDFGGIDMNKPMDQNTLNAMMSMMSNFQQSRIH